MTHFTSYPAGLMAHETPAQRMQRRLEQDDLRRDRKPVSLYWPVEFDAMRAVPGEPFDARILA